MLTYILQFALSPAAAEVFTMCLIVIVLLWTCHMQWTWQPRIPHVNKQLIFWVFWPENNSDVHCWICFLDHSTICWRVTAVTSSAPPMVFQCSPQIDGDTTILPPHTHTHKKRIRQQSPCSCLFLCFNYLILLCYPLTKKQSYSGIASRIYWNTAAMQQDTQTVEKLATLLHSHGALFRRHMHSWGVHSLGAT